LGTLTGFAVLAQKEIGCGSRASAPWIVGTISLASSAGVTLSS
jgi:hypothetical protein